MIRVAMKSMMRILGALSAVGLMVGTSVAAQQADRNEKQFQGRIDNRSPKDDDKPYQVQTINLEAGKRYSFSAESEDFDPMMRVSFADDNDEELAEDDDGGEGRNAYLEFSPGQSGLHRLRVVAVNGDVGTYVLNVRELPPLPPALRANPVGSNTMVINRYSGTLTETDGEIKGRRVDDFLFHFQGGKQVFIFLDATSDGFDPYLEIRAANRRLTSDPIASDDDGGDRMNAFIAFTPEETGDYIVRATSADENAQTGRYQLRVGQEP